MLPANALESAILFQGLMSFADARAMRLDRRCGHGKLRPFKDSVVP
jgi:hypothetical protein